MGKSSLALKTSFCGRTSITQIPNLVSKRQVNGQIDDFFVNATPPPPAHPTPHKKKQTEKQTNVKFATLTLKMGGTGIDMQADNGAENNRKTSKYLRYLLQKRQNRCKNQRKIDIASRIRFGSVLGRFLTQTLCRFGSLLVISVSPNLKKGVRKSMQKYVSSCVRLPAHILNF